MTPVFLNRVATAVPRHDVHRKFVEFAPSLLADDRSRRLFRRMADRAQIEHRFSFIEPDPSPDGLDRAGFYPRGTFPGTGKRMGFYEAHAFDLAREALEQLGLPAVKDTITHLIVTTCTGFYAPGLDLQIVEHFGLPPGVERTLIGFMGCQAAIPAMKLATHIVRSRPEARVLMLNLELCTIHLQETSDLQSVLSFLIFADGCAASLLSAEPTGLEIAGFGSTVLPASRDQIRWHIGGNGFLMWLDGAVPGTIARGLSNRLGAMLPGCEPAAVDIWAIHPGGRSILDAAQEALAIEDHRLAASRGVLRDFGNMSSATVMFVLRRILAQGDVGHSGCALSFGPGLSAEAMLFRVRGHA